MTGTAISLRRSPCRNQLLHTARLALADQSLSLRRPELARRTRISIRSPRPSKRERRRFRLRVDLGPPARRRRWAPASVDKPDSPLEEQSGANPSLAPQFPASWENTGKFINSDLRHSNFLSKTRVRSATYASIPCAAEQGNNCALAGIKSADQGKLFTGSGKTERSHAP